MSSTIDRLKSVFGWSSASVSVRKKGINAEDGSPVYDSHNPSEMYHDMMQTRKRNRKNRYDVYDAMDKMSDVASILDAYAEDATQTDQEHECTVWVEGSDSKVVEELNSFLKNVGVEDWIEGVCRDTAKFGDDFAQVFGGPETGVVSLGWLDPRDVERIENKQGILLGFESTRSLSEYRKKLESNKNELPTFKPWDVLHFRIYKQKRLSFEKHRNIYGTSLLWSSDRIAKQVKILDDLLMIVRLTRSMDRKTYYVDVGRSPVEEEVRILKRWRRALKRKTFIDPSESRFDSRFNPWAFTEDEFWPIKDGSNSRVETNSGITDVKEMVDIDHFRDKFFGSFRAPKAFFGYEGDVNAKSTLSSQSVRWARAVNSLQRSVKRGLTRLCQIHLAYKGMDTDVNKFSVMMVTPSVLELLDRLEAWQTIVDIAERMSTLGETLELDKFEWTKYILENVMWLSKDEVANFVKLLKQQHDQLRDDPGATPPPSDDSGDSGEPDGSTKDEDGYTVTSNRSLLTEIDDAVRRIATHGKFQGARPNELPRVPSKSEDS